MRNRFRRGFWMNQHLTTEEPTTVPERVVIPMPRQRRRHPVITPTMHRGFKVMRAWRGSMDFDGHIQYGVWLECIGQFHELWQALALSNEELGNARVVDRDNKFVSANLQPIEDRD